MCVCPVSSAGSWIVRRIPQTRSRPFRPLIEVRGSLVSVLNPRFGISYLNKIKIVKGCHLGRVPIEGTNDTIIPPSGELNGY